MARPTRLPLYGVLAVVFAGLAQPAEFNEVFQAYSRADYGGCQGYLDKDGLFDDWHQEVYDMVEAAANGLDQYLNIVQVQMAAHSFFGIAPDPHSVPQPLTPEGDIYSLFAQIESFLDGAETPKKTPLPWLFCDSTFLKFKDPTYQAQDKDCIGMIDPDQTPIVIGNEYKTQLTGGKRPFWSEDMCTYVFELPGQGDTYCAAVASQGGLAVTIDTVHNELDTLRSLPIKARTKLQAVQPKSLTLLHEIFHALYRSTYFDAGDDEDYGVVQCMERASGKLGRDRDPERNPDNWAYFALAMYYLLNPDSNGKTWDFSSGVAKAA